MKRNINLFFFFLVVDLMKQCQGNLHHILNYSYTYVYIEVLKAKQITLTIYIMFFIILFISIIFVIHNYNTLNPYVPDNGIN